MPTRIGTITRAGLRRWRSTPAPNVVLPAGVVASAGRTGSGAALAPRLFARSIPAPNVAVPKVAAVPNVVVAAGDLAGAAVSAAAASARIARRGRALRALRLLRGLR